MGGAVFDRAAAYQLTEVAHDTWLLTVQSPFDAYVKSTCVYLVKDEAGDGHVIDSGWGGEAGTSVLLAALSAVGLPVERLRTITATHVHRDHLGQAAALRELSGARIVLSGADAAEMVAPMPDLEMLMNEWGVPGSAANDLRSSVTYRSPHPQVAVDLELVDGDTLPIAGRDIRVISTPGHTPGSICLDDEARNVLFTGDTVLPNIHPGIGIEGNASALDGYLRSLRNLADTVPSRLACPGHGAPFYELRTRIAQHLFHLARRNREIADQLAHDPSASVWTLASKVRWSAGWDGLGELRFNALQQTAMHRAFVAVNGHPIHAADPAGLPALRYVA